MHLIHILGGASIQCVLHYRLFSTPLPPKGPLQTSVWPQAFVDLHQTVGSSQYGNQGILQLLARTEFDRLLGNLDPLRDGLKQPASPDFDTYACQTRTRRKIGFDFFRNGDRLIHSDEAPVCDVQFFVQVNPSLLFGQILFLFKQPAPISGEI
jgi:hypothetical protein